MYACVCVCVCVCVYILCIGHLAPGVIKGSEVLENIVFIINTLTNEFLRSQMESLRFHQFGDTVVAWKIATNHISLVCLRIVQNR